MTISAQKFNEELEVKKIDEIFALCEKFEKQLLEIIFQTLFDNSYRMVKQIYPFYNQEMMVKGSNQQHNQLDSLYDFLNNYSVASNPKLENCTSFVEGWSKLMFVLLELLGVIFSSFSEKKDRLIELMNKDVESMGYIMDSLNKKDVNQRLLLVNIQKLILIDANTMKNFIENQHEFLRNIPRVILAFNFLKRTEREANLSLRGVLGKDGVEGDLDDALETYFTLSGEISLESLNESLNNFDEIRKLSEVVIGRIQENNGGANFVENIPSLEVLSMILNL